MRRLVERFLSCPAPPVEASPRVTVARVSHVLAELAVVLEVLSAEGIPALLLKGVPLALFVYRDMGRRPMADADVLVPLERFADARRALEARGFGLRLAAPRGLLTHVDHSLAFRRPGRPEVDVHYFALDECRWPGVDEGLWARSQERRVLGHPAFVPDRTDLLFHVLAHGYRGSTKWVGDAEVLLQGPVDWPLLLAEARRRRLVLPLAATLRHVGRRQEAEELDRLPVAAWEPFDFWVRAGRSPARRFFLSAVDYLRYASGTGERPSPGGFADYLAARWALPGGRWGLARELGARARAVLQGRPGREPGGG